ncbi:MAG: hypothetical protein AAFX81_13170 [Pseudomonadota bacterium]
MPDTITLRRRADGVIVAGDHLLLFGQTGQPARIATVIDQLDDAGHRLPLLEDVVSAFPHVELFTIDDRRREPGRPVAGRPVTVLARPPEPQKRSLFGLGRRPSLQPQLRRWEADQDVVLRIGDRRARRPRVSADSLELSYILGLDDERQQDDETAASLGSRFRDRCALAEADVVWCGSRRLMGALRRRWNVDASLLYPPAELSIPIAPAAAKSVVIALIDAASPNWLHRLDVLAKARGDLSVVVHGEPAKPWTPRRNRITQLQDSAEAFQLALGRTVAVLAPAGDAFDPRIVWAQAAGVPVIAAQRSVGAELVLGLEQRAPTGIVLEDDGDDALIDAVGFIARRPDLWPTARLVQHGRRWARARFRQTLKSHVLDAWCVHNAAPVALADGVEIDEEAPEAEIVEPLTRSSH